MFHAKRPEQAATLDALALTPTLSPSNQSHPERPALELRGIGKSFGPHKVLGGVSLSVPPGRIYGIIGRSGAGKTTLIRIASLLEKPEVGEIRYGGVPVSGVRGAELLAARRKAGFVFQNFNLFSSRTVFGNVAFPLEAAGCGKLLTRKRVEDLVELVGLSHKLDSPSGRLSGGERQRVAIARALANNPQILFCDEATSALDPETTSQILDLIRSLRDKLGLTVLMVTHQMDVVRRVCDDVAIIADGSIVERGEVAAVFAGPRTETARRLVAEVRHA